jgi:hypothetical protein
VPCHIYRKLILLSEQSRSLSFVTLKVSCKILNRWPSNHQNWRKDLCRQPHQGLCKYYIIIFFFFSNQSGRGGKRDLHLHYHVYIGKQVSSTVSILSSLLVCYSLIINSHIITNTYICNITIITL